MDGVPQLTQPPSHPARASITAFGRPTPARSGTTHTLPARPIGGSPAHSSSRRRSRSTSIATSCWCSDDRAGGRRSAGSRQRVACVPISPVKTGERLRLRIINATTARGLFAQARGPRGPGHGDRRPAGGAVSRARQPRRRSDPATGSICSSIPSAMPGQRRRCSPAAGWCGSGATDRAAGLRGRRRRSHRASIGAAPAAAQSAAGAHRSAGTRSRPS